MSHFEYAILWFAHGAALGALCEAGWTWETVPGDRIAGWQRLTLRKPRKVVWRCSERAFGDSWVAIEGAIETP